MSTHKKIINKSKSMSSYHKQLSLLTRVTFCACVCACGWTFFILSPLNRDIELDTNELVACWWVNIGNNRKCGTDEFDLIRMWTCFGKLTKIKFLEERIEKTKKICVQKIAKNQFLLTKFFHVRLKFQSIPVREYRTWH